VTNQPGSAALTPKPPGDRSPRHATARAPGRLAPAQDEHQARRTRLIRLLLRQGAAVVCPQSLGALAGRPTRSRARAAAGCCKSRIATIGTAKLRFMAQRIHATTVEVKRASHVVMIPARAKPRS
jgi:hypothetical protein